MSNAPALPESAPRVAAPSLEDTAREWANRMPVAPIVSRNAKPLPTDAAVQRWDRLWAVADALGFRDARKAVAAGRIA